MASLDLAKALDSLPHQEIYLSLQEANVPEPLCRLILHIHSRTQCAIVHGSECEVACMWMWRGLRQGWLSSGPHCLCCVVGQGLPYH